MNQNIIEPHIEESRTLSMISYFLLNALNVFYVFTSIESCYACFHFITHLNVYKNWAPASPTLLGSLILPVFLVWSFLTIVEKVSHELGIYLGLVAILIYNAPVNDIVSMPVFGILTAVHIMNFPKVARRALGRLSQRESSYIVLALVLLHALSYEYFLLPALVRTRNVMTRLMITIVRGGQIAIGTFFFSLALVHILYGLGITKGADDEEGDGGVFNIFSVLSFLLLLVVSSRGLFFPDCLYAGLTAMLCLLSSHFIGKESSAVERLAGITGIAVALRILLAASYALAAWKIPPANLPASES
jgi:hypothetical protein